MEKSYRLDCTPGYLSRGGTANRKLWNSQQELQIHYQLTIGHQHGDSRLFRGPLQLEVQFFLQKAIGTKTPKAGSYSVTRPDLSDLLKFIEVAAIGILFTDDCFISSLIASKIYHTESYTLFTLRELDDKKSQTPQK